MMKHELLIEVLINVIQRTFSKQSGYLFQLLEYLKPNFEKNKRSKDLGALLDSCSWDDIGNFQQTCIKNSRLQIKSIEIWVNSHTVHMYLTMHVSILDNIRHLNFDLSGSLKVKVKVSNMI